MPARFSVLGFGKGLIERLKKPPTDTYSVPELETLQTVADKRLHWVIGKAGSFLIVFVIAAFLTLAVLVVVLYLTAVHTVSVLNGLLTAVFLVVIVGGVFAVLADYFDRRAQNCLLASLTPPNPSQLPTPMRGGSA